METPETETPETPETPETNLDLDNYDFKNDRTVVKVRFTKLKYFNKVTETVHEQSVIGKMLKRQCIKFIKENHGADMVLISNDFNDVTFSVPTVELYRLQGS